MEKDVNVALYGLGTMGMEVAIRLANRFKGLQVSDLNHVAVEHAQSNFSARPITSPEDLKNTDFVVLCLPSPKATQSVLEQIAPALKKEAIIIELSTVNPQDIEASAHYLANYGLEIIDASLMAGVSQMRAGSATLLVGGEDKVIESSKVVLDAIATKQIIFGPRGSGAAAKVINNALAHAVMVVLAEAGAMASASKVSIDKLIELWKDPQMGIQRPLTHRLAERILNEDYVGGMPMDAACKDSHLALSLAQSSGVPLFAIQACHSVYEMAVASGLARDDYAAVAKLWTQWGTPIRNDL